MPHLALFEDQNKFAEAVLSAQYRKYIFGGSVRSGKTIVILSLLLLFCKVYPGSRWVVIRQDRPTLKRTTLETFRHYVLPPATPHLFNKSELTYTFPQWNGSTIMFLEENFEGDRDFNRFKGLEVNGAFLSQCEELQEGLYNVLKMRVGQWKITPMPPAYIFADLNPTDAWPKNLFYDPWKNGTLPADTYYQEADIFKNPFNPADYLESLKELPPELYDRFVRNNWEMVESIYRLVTNNSIYACKGERPVVTGAKRYLGVDVGHRGSDPSTWYMIEGENIVFVDERKTSKTTECRDNTIRLINEFEIEHNNVVIDAVGVGAGVIDSLEEKGYFVIAMRGGESAPAKDYSNGNFKFAHWKALNYWIAADFLKQGLIGNFTNEKLIVDAKAVWYFIRGEKEIITESKDELRKRIGRSCDHWDAFCYACWARWRDEVYGGPSLLTSSMVGAGSRTETQDA